MRLRIALALSFLLVAAGLSAAGDVTVVYYNIKFLDAQKLPTQGNRAQRLKEVIAQTEGHVFGLCEIKDRAALQAIFPPAEWGIFIDDDSTGESQDNAIVFRKSAIEMVGGPADLDADDEHYLFPAGSDGSAFPGRRDVLFATLRDKASGKTFVMMVVHLKARVGGRHTTEFRRVTAARMIAHAIETKFDDVPVVIGGDWNDNPDDRSLNILETGDPNAEFGPPKASDPVFLTNLMEPLVAAGHVSHGKNQSHIANGKINTIDPASRKKNADGHGTNKNTGPILFDQILVSGEMKAFHVADSTKVFDGGSALLGGGDTTASDHLPVLAKFNFPVGGVVDPAPAGGVRIAALLPKPAGNAAEEVHLKNTGTAAVNFQGWRLVDKGQNEFLPTGTIQPGGTLVIKLPAGRLPLNNTGDSVTLFDPAGAQAHAVSYTAAQVTTGVLVNFP